MVNLKYKGYILGVLGGLALGFYLGILALQTPDVKDYIIGYFWGDPYNFLGIAMPLPIIFFIGPVLITLGLFILAIYRPSRSVERIRYMRTNAEKCRYCGEKLVAGNTFCPKCNRSQA